MLTISLVRALRTDYCTLGRVQVKERSFYSIERPWIEGDSPGGARGLSCVPVGRYRLERHGSEAHPNSWALVNPALHVWHWPWEVPKGMIGRTAILIHPANYAHELAGCIALGKEQRKSPNMGNRWGVFRSRDAVNEFNQLLNGSVEIYLDITEEGG